MKVIDIAIKDLIRSYRSFFAIGMMLAAPLLITALIYFAFSGMLSSGGSFDLPPVTVAVANQDEPPENSSIAIGDLLIEFLNDERMPDWMLVDEVNGEQAARAAVESKTAGVAVIVPSDFTAVLLSENSQTGASLTLLQDPTLTIGPRLVQDLLTQFLDGISGTGIALSVARSQANAHGVAIDSKDLPNLAQQYSEWFTAIQQNLHHSSEPYLIAQLPATDGEAQQSADDVSRMLSMMMAGQLIFFAFFTGAYTAQSILKEQEEGTLQRLFTTPASRTVILAGKFLAVFITVIVQVIVLLIAAGLLFGISWGQPVSMALVVLGLVVTASGFGLFMLSFLKSVAQSGTVIGGLLTVSGMLGGLFSIAIPMPAAFTSLSLLFPQGWVMKGWKLALEGAGPAEVLLPSVVMLAIGAVLFIVGSLLFRRRFQ